MLASHSHPVSRARPRRRLVFQRGFVGVDVFFVLSRYLITGLLVRELGETGRIRFLRFYARRLKRLLPALSVMLLVSAGAALLLLSNAEASGQMGSAPFAATWTSNLYFALRTIDYFNELAFRDLFLHTWSLGVEEQFYLIWPPILLASMLLARRMNSVGRERMVWWFSLGFLFFASLALSVTWARTTPSAAFYLMPSRIWQFALGGLLMLALSGMPMTTVTDNRSGWRLTTIPARFALALGLILIAGSATLLHANLAYPGLWALAPALGAALVIAAGHGLSAQQHGPLAHPVLVWMGDRSYSWYLWHWPILMLGFTLGLGEGPVTILGLVLLSLLAAVISYRLVELPFWKGRISHAEPRRILALNLLVMALAVALMFHISRVLAPAGDAPAAAIGANARADVPIIYQMPCDAWYHHARVEPCVFGTEDASQTVVLVGDSVGAQWFSMVPELFPPPTWRIVVLTKSSCPMVDEDYFYPRIKQVYTVCSDWRNAVLDELERVPPDVLIMGSAATYDFTETQWVEGTARVLERIGNVAGTIFVIPGTPSLGFDGPGCVDRHLSPGGRIDRDACQSEGRLPLVAPIASYLKDSANRFPNVHVLDLNDLVCPGDVCNAVSDDGLVVFRDGQHLTDRFVRARIGEVLEQLSAYRRDAQAAWVP